MFSLSLQWKSLVVETPKVLSGAPPYGENIRNRIFAEVSSGKTKIHLGSLVSISSAVFKLSTILTDSSRSCHPVPHFPRFL